MIEIIPIGGIPDVVAGDDVATLLAEALDASDIGIHQGDVVVVTHKIVSKAEGRVVELADDGPDAHRHLVDAESRAIIRRRGDLAIAITRHGFVCANAGVDRSNAGPARAVLLPLDPDLSARRIRARLAREFGVEPAVVVSDTFGRPWRRGLTDVAIGVAGFAPIADLRGLPDQDGRILDVTEIAIADELAAAADLVMGKAARIPAAVIRGVTVPSGAGSAAELVRPAAEDLFR